MQLLQLRVHLLGRGRIEIASEIGHDIPGRVVISIALDLRPRGVLDMPQLLPLRLGAVVRLRLEDGIERPVDKEIDELSPGALGHGISSFRIWMRAPACPVAWSMPCREAPSRSSIRPSTWTHP